MGHRHHRVASGTDLLKLYASSGYQGPKFPAGLYGACRQINLEIVKRSELHKFVVLPKP